MDVGETLVVRNRDDWRRWLAKHHDERKEIWLVYYRKTSGRTGISYDESVEEALAYGWIDGQTKGIDTDSFAGRFTPRKPNSNWAPSNIARVKKLIAEGRMAAPGLAVIPPEIAKALKKSLPLAGRAREGVRKR